MRTPIFGNVAVDDNTEHLPLAAPAAGSMLQYHLSALIVTSTTAVAQTVTVKNGAGGSTIMALVFPAAAGTQIMLFGDEPGLVLTKEKALAVISSAANAALQVTAVGYLEI